MLGKLLNKLNKMQYGEHCSDPRSCLWNSSVFHSQLLGKILACLVNNVKQHLDSLLSAK